MDFSDCRRRRLNIAPRLAGIPREVLTEIREHLVFEANWRDCGSSACMVIRLLESLFAGSTKGKGYKQEMIAVRSELHKPLQAYLKGFAC